MQLHGKNIIAGKTVDSSSGTFAARGVPIRFEEASEEHIHSAFDAAERAFHQLRQTPPERRASFLERIAEELEKLGDELLIVANAETALPIAERLVGERGRTVNQLRMFAALVREGSWVDARIDRANPDRKPLAKPDIRRMLIPVGPVAVFSASNFPLAFSVAGGDTASAIAAGCPVVVKAHPAHPGTSELTARAVAAAATAEGMPAGIFSLLHSTRNDIALAVVQHPLAKAVAFTGSLHAGRALYDAAAHRPDPIPVYAEMGSINPVFLLPGALRERAEAIAQGLTASVLLGGGQFCTCPGWVAGLKSDSFDRFLGKLETGIAAASPVTMLHDRLLESFETGAARICAVQGVTTRRSTAQPAGSVSAASPALFVAGAEILRTNPELHEELFGPSTVAISCTTREEMEDVARDLTGQLTATIHGTPEDLADYATLVSILESKVGRLIFNGFPTGVEVCAAMHHGGPYPATTDSRSTSVGTAAILRFARPLAYQNFPQDALPPQLKDANPLGIWRLVDGAPTRGAD